MHIHFTGDRTTDKIMNMWSKWYENKYHCEFSDLTDSELDELMFEVGMEDFVEYVIQEYPQIEMTGFDYDVEYTWKTFVENTKHGYDVEEALSEFMNSYIIDNAYVNEYIDRDYIAEA